MTRAEFIEELKKGDPEEIVVPIYWAAEDIIGCAANIDVVLSDEDIAYIAGTLTEQFDANLGISWDTIESLILEVVHAIGD